MALTHASMASITSSSSSPTTIKKHFNFPNSKLCSTFLFSFSTPSLPLPSISHAVSDSLSRFNSVRCSASVEDSEWDWERWRHRFHEVEEQERLLRILKSRIGNAVKLEDYDDAATLKVAIAAVAKDDTVGTVISNLNRAVEEERYSDAAFLRDEAGTGLVGWWAGMSKDTIDPHGVIIRITPEHGRYVATSYSPRQLATSASGVPLFEIFLIKNKNGEFKSQAVYLNQRGGSDSTPKKSTKALDAADRLSSVESPEDKSEQFVGTPEDPEVVDVEMKVLKLTTPDKVDKDIVSKVIEEVTEEEGNEDEDADEYSNKDNETETLELKDVESEIDDENELNSSLEAFQHAEQNEIAVNKAVIGGLVQKPSSSLTTRDVLRVPAKLETSGQDSFLFTIPKLFNQQVGHGKEKPSPDKPTKIQGEHSIVDSDIFNFARFIGKGKVPSKVLKNVEELVRFNLNRDRNHERLSESTMFSRIEIPTSLDPLNGLYISAHGPYSTEVIQLRCRYGYWQEDGGKKESSDLKFYQYVEALKLTGDPFVPAGQVAFRAKVGERHRLPPSGMISKELGLIARYRGQGRIAEPGFQNPRWVDGELVILDGKFFLKTGPVVGFLYWVPKRPYIVLWSPLRLQQ
ncbi:hypothetical protein PHAVU_006G201700 [Phaseolus vulgaris]|uniref:Uncharacterized protein n=1 Tax=Phaseolus vulgaris TaxID=3885 RepID=V7BTI6_PHAVU|nr:hypothetical protein PHAVU_006G201700g [Phaseolus vulgaris]ESW20355.1 hypothetical protein PHAVU_006G201700g [Phaseolus vulgaris]